ncbi:CYFA0S01e19108g1_1 [Cyberlindnera fabianii]|uniref:CYFA0S01e19108g1_1 n=1 Tax=Cyberlindnera fabianii TaxID=36022 RepID=A0A061AL98_CYBFA|nr:CYFA0S01e19108g1_1 [Cyberlindnera fabianii]
MSQQLLFDEKYTARKRGSSMTKTLVCLAVSLLALGYTAYSAYSTQYSSPFTTIGQSPLDKLSQIDLNALIESKPEVCPIPPKLVPPKQDGLVDLSYFGTPEYKNHSLTVWAGAVKLYTPSFDDLGEVGVDPRWETFYDLEHYFKKTFPTLHKVAKLDHVNTHGLVYTIEGSDKGLKPVMLTGHQDVVPVPAETEWRWKHPPRDAYFDGEWLWGRGASDCKNNVVAIFEAVEQLLSSGYKPKRTIVLAFGFDEESSGTQGAGKITDFLMEQWGENGLLLIVDEGGLGIADFGGARFALPSTGEKGYIDVHIKLTTPGGHSSVPPKHTSIGMMGELAVLLEKKEYPLDVSEISPYYHTLQCQAKYSDALEPEVRKGILHLDDPKIKKFVLEELAKDGTNKALLSTTRAIDVVYGGVKINALPEEVVLKVNHRVSYESSLDIVKDHILDCVSKVAESHGLGITAFEEEIKGATAAGNFVITSDGDLDPAPSTPVFNNPTWDVLSGTIKHVFEDFAVYPEELFDPAISPKVHVAPSCMTGNTDTKHYWDLTKNIYRFSPVKQLSRENAHAIDERVQLDAHVEGVAWYYAFLQNLDAYVSE